MGMAAAAELSTQDLKDRQARLQALRDQLWEGLKDRNPMIQLNGALRPRLAHNLNITIPEISGSRLLRTLRPRLACSSGSACSRGEPSHVLRSIGRSHLEAEASLRLSLGRDTTTIDIDGAIEVITTAIQTLTQR